MIKLYGRMIPALVRGANAPSIPATMPLTSRFRVLPHDIDLNRHLNNGRYLQFIDVNRAEWLLRTGIIDFVRKNRWKPILGSTAIHFRRELRLWDTGIATTRLLGWDDRWAYLEHRIDTHDHKPVAVALARAGFRTRAGWMSIDALRSALPHPLPDMVLPAHADAWKALDVEFGAMIGRSANARPFGSAPLPSPDAEVTEFAK